MSTITEDSLKMQIKFGMIEGLRTKEKLDFRVNTLQKEEFEELKTAVKEMNAEEVVDALIDTIVIAVGTLQIFGVDVDKAWATVWHANMAKERGTKNTRPESGGFDLIKPEGWKKPDHSDNHGELDVVLKPEESETESPS